MGKKYNRTSDVKESPKNSKLQQTRNTPRVRLKVPQRPILRRRNFDVAKLKVENKVSHVNLSSWICFAGSNLKTSQVKIKNPGYREHLQRRIIDGSLVYGEIDPKIILPYLMVSQPAENFVKFKFSKTDRTEEYAKNLSFVYNSVKKSYFDTKKFMEAAKSRLRYTIGIADEFTPLVGQGKILNITTSEFDGFPIFVVELFEENGEHIVTAHTAPYGIKTENDYLLISKIYGQKRTMEKDPYSYFYDYIKLMNLEEEVCKQIWDYGRVNKVVFRTKTDEDISSCTSIVNLSKLVNLSEPSHNIEIPKSSFAKSESIKMDMSMHPEKYETLHKKQLAFILKTELNILTSNISFADGNPVTGSYRFTRENPFLWMQERNIQTVFGLLDLQSPEDNSREALKRYIDIGGNFDIGEFRYADNINSSTLYHSTKEYKIPYPYNANLLLDYYASSRGYKIPTDVLDDQRIGLIYSAIASMIMEYGVPSKKNRKPFTRRMVKIIIETAKTAPETSHHKLLDNIADLIEVNRDILNFRLFEKILTTGKTSNLDVSPVKIDRSLKWQNFTTRQFILMRNVYKNENMHGRDFTYIKTPEYSLETIICEYKHSELETLIETLGMVAPIDVDIFDYFVETLPMYKAFIKRPHDFDSLKPRSEIKEDLEAYCDIEIFMNIFGGNFFHTSRQDLINKSNKFLLGSPAFVMRVADSFDEPPENEPPEEMRKRLEEQKEISNEYDRKSLYIDTLPPSGNPFNVTFIYIDGEREYSISITELDALNRSIICDDFTVKRLPLNVTLGDESGGKYTKVIVPVTVPKNAIDMFETTLEYSEIYFKGLLQNVYDLCEMKGLTEDLEIDPNISEEYLDNLEDEDDLYIINESNKSFKSVLLKIKNNKISNLASSLHEKKIVDVFFRYNMKTRNLIVKGLFYMFDCGMMQRQWKGVRGEYPMTNEQSGSERNFENQKDLIVGVKLHEINDVLFQLEKKEKSSAQFFKDLQIMTFQTGSKSPLICEGSDTNKRNIGKLLNDVGVGDSRQIDTRMCIRMASSKMINTAYYHLRLFDEDKKIGKYEYWKLENIY
jgi:hypothetical protein